jgi:hypothetical protein
MDPFIKKYFRLPRAKIAFLRFILESYDGLAFARTLDNLQALVEVAYPPSRRADAEALLAELSEKIPLEEMSPPVPGEYPPL